MANPQFGRPMAGHLINNENILQAITVDEQGRLYTTSGSGTASNRVQGAVLDGGSTTGLAPIVLGATNSGQVRSLTAFSQSSDGITLASAFGLEVNSVIRLLNAAGTSDRMRTAGAGTGTAGTGVLGAAPLGFSGSTYFHIYSEDGSNDASTTIPIGLVSNTRSKLWNGTTWDRQRANTEGTAVSGGAYTSTAVGATLTNHNARGVILHMNLTAAGGASGVTTTLQALDPVSNVWQSIFADSSARTALQAYRYIIYPGAVTLGSYSAASGGAVPRTWRVIVVNNDGASYTFSVGYQLIV